MADYSVNYNINVVSNGAAEAFREIATASEGLSTALKHLQDFNTEVQKMLKTSPKISFNTENAQNSLNKLLKKLDTVKKKASEINVIGGATGTSAKNTGGKNAAAPPVAPPPAQPKPAPKPAKPAAAPRQPLAKTRLLAIPSNIGYRVVGHTMLDAKGVGILDFAKGMGVAYGITALGSLLGKSVKEATEYDNLMATARNILKTHDPDKGTFDSRFYNMERLVRNVGVETKFTAPQVADAAKFLAMAGMDVEAINRSIRPIADIALVGDTDLGRTADVVTNIMTGYGIEPKKMRKAADVMTMTFTKSNTTLMEIADAYKYSASLLSAGGVDFEEATAAFGVLGNAGIKGSQAGTTMRTIVANLVNPTKKQLSNWNRIGVSRFDEAGNLRPLSAIFEDLKKAGLYVDDFYKMFHRTAAQGAISLAQNVDRWNEIIKANFMSDGLAEQLAEEKKNTIQGLWYQLTSSFTEAGMKMFDANNGPMRQFLRNMTSWIKSADFGHVLSNVSDGAMKALGVIVNLTKKLASLYSQFKPVINGFLLMQLRIVSLLVPLRMFKGVWNFGAAVMSTANKIGHFNTQVHRCFAYVSKLTALGKKHKNGNLVLPHIIGKRIMAYVPGMLGMAGAAGGAFLGSTIGEPGSALNNWMTGVGGLVGGLAGTFLLTNPMIAAPATIAMAVYGYIKYQQSVKKAIEANRQFLASTASVNGINYSERATEADKWLRVVYNRQMDANKALGEYVRLMREQLGLMDAVKDDGKQVPLKESHKEALENAKKPFGFWKFLSVGKKRRSVLNNNRLPDGTVDGDMIVKRIYNGPQIHDLSCYAAMSNGFSQNFYRFNGVKYTSTEKKSLKQVSASKFLYALGRDKGEGTTLQKDIARYNKLLLSAKTLEDFDAVIKDTKNHIDNMWKNVIPGSQYWKYKDFEEKGPDVYESGYHYVSGYAKKFEEDFSLDNPLTPNARALSYYREILENFQNGVTVPDELLKAFLLENGIGIFEEKIFGEFGSPEFMEKLGFAGGKWNEVEREYVNPETGAIEKRTLSPTQAREQFLLFGDMINKILAPLDKDIAKLFDPVTSHPAWGFGAEKHAAAEAREGSTMALDNGDEYVFKNGKWEQVGNPAIRYTNDAFQKMLASENGGSSTTTTPDINPGDYESHYSPQGAAPKQIIVKIESLMNVESIDLSNPDNAAVISDLKGQLTQALVDAVHDFDLTFQA